MKAISLWQPWASAIACNAKRIETRHWPTNYRGPLLIHAAKRMHAGELYLYERTHCWKGALMPILEGTRGNLKAALPFGAIVAVATLVDCQRTTSLTVGIDIKHTRGGKTWTERDMGDFTPGRFGWILDHIRPLKTPLPFRGAQGLFDVPDSVLPPEAFGGGD